MLERFLERRFADHFDWLSHWRQDQCPDGRTSGPSASPGCRLPRRDGALRQVRNSVPLAPVYHQCCALQDEVCRYGQSFTLHGLRLLRFR